MERSSHSVSSAIAVVVTIPVICRENSNETAPMSEQRAVFKERRRNIHEDRQRKQPRKARKCVLSLTCRTVVGGRTSPASGGPAEPKR